MEEDGDAAEKYIPAAAVRSTFAVSNTTLRNWAEAGKVAVVRTPGSGKRLYKRSDVAKLFSGYKPHTAASKEALEKGGRVCVCYARVSSPKQKDDLDRQVEALKAAKPGYEIITDVASGVNWKRPGLLSVLDRALSGGIQEVAVAHRDRLCRFAFELIQHVLERAGCRVVVLDKSDKMLPDAREAELRDDLLSIVTVFVARNNGQRAAQHRREKKEREEQEKEAAPEEEEQRQHHHRKRRRVESDEEPEVEDPSDCSSSSDA